MVDELNRRGIATKVINTQRGFDTRVWKEVRDFVASGHFDIVHAHGTRAASNVFWAANKLHKPLIYTVHGWSFHPDQSMLVRKARELSELFITSRADRTICVSRSNETEGIQRFGMKRSEVIYNAVDLQKFNPARTFADVRGQLGIACDKIVVGYICRITKQKDPFTMLRAMKLLEARQDIVLLVVGDGDMKDQALALAADLKLHNQVVFQPFRSDIPDVLNAIDIYCLPSLWEGFPIGILEAMAMDKVVVASPVDGTRELVHHNHNGILVENSNPLRLANAIVKLASDPSLSSRLSNNALHFVKSRYGISHMVDEVQNLYSGLINVNR
jgi:glycosyltransferase involved in cell wall biosynthesis